MSPPFLAFAVALIVAQLVLPRRLAFLPLLVATCHLPNSQVLALGGFSFSMTRLIILIGLVRAAMTTGRPTLSPLDVAATVWSILAILSSFAHEFGAVNPLTLRLGIVYNFMGGYLYARAFLFNRDSIIHFAKYLSLVLIVLALFMGVEKIAVKNVYSQFGGVSRTPAVRDGRVRAQGPFAHSILAGTAGASSFALALFLWRTRRKLAIAGMGASLVITYSSGSSGPLVTLMASMGALCLWRWRTELPRIRKAALVMLVLLHLIMQAPVWYLMARVDLTGSSTGYHRARLIDGALKHLDEWWFAGTDYTRHWMVTGVSWSADHTDITNHYLKMGVLGGLPLMIAFIAILIKAFQLLGRTMKRLRIAKDPDELLLWTVGATLFAHCITFMSVTYFDQVAIMFCFAVGIVPGLCSMRTVPQDFSKPRENIAPDTSAVPTGFPQMAEVPGS